MALLIRHNIGSSADGADGATVRGAPADNATHYTFDGSDDCLSWEHIPGEGWRNMADFKVRFRAHNRLGDGYDAQVFWKTGNPNYGVAVGIDLSGSVGVFGRDGSAVGAIPGEGVLSALTIGSVAYADNVWYTMYVSSTRVALFDDSGTLAADATGAWSAESYEGAGVDLGIWESLEAYELAYPPLKSGEDLAAGAYYDPIEPSGAFYKPHGPFDGDIDFVEVWQAGTLAFPDDLPEVSGAFPAPTGGPTTPASVHGTFPAPTVSGTHPAASVAGTFPAPTCAATTGVAGRAAGTFPLPEMAAVSPSPAYVSGLFPAAWAAAAGNATGRTAGVFPMPVMSAFGTSAAVAAGTFPSPTASAEGRASVTATITGQFPAPLIFAAGYAAATDGVETATFGIWRHVR